VEHLVGLDPRGLEAYKGHVASLAVARWVLLVACRHPLGWLVGLGVLLAVPTLVQFSPWLASSPGAIPEARAWWIPLTWLGLAHGVVVLTRGGAFLEQLTGPARFRALFAGLLATPIALQGLLALGASLAGLGFPARSLLTEALGVDLVGASLALLVLAVPLGAGGRVALFLAIVWLAPALLADGGLLGRFSAPLASAPMSGEGMGPFVGGAVSASLGSAGVAALLAAAWQVHVPPNARTR